MNVAELLNQKDEIEFEIFQLSQDEEEMIILVMRLEDVLRQIVLLGG